MMWRMVMSSVCAAVVLATVGLGPAASLSARMLESPHTYFDALVQRPEHLRSFSLRDQRQLETRANGGYAQCNSCPLAVTYDPTNDLDPRRQDAAKVVIPAGKNNLGNQVHLPIKTSDSETYLVTWDAWFGAEYDRRNTGMTNQKTFQFSSDDGLWLEVQSRWSLGEDGLARVTGRAYNANRPRNIAYGPNITDPETLPMVGKFILRPERWTRYWVYIDQRPGDDYDLISLWMADEQTNPMQVWDKLQLNAYNGRIDDFWLEFNTSTSGGPPDRGPLVTYFRNFAILRNVGNPTSFLQRPNAGTPLPPPPQRPAAPRNLRVIPPLW